MKFSNIRVKSFPFLFFSISFRFWTPTYMGGKPQRPTTSEETARGRARTEWLIGSYLASILITSVRHRVTGFLLRFCVLLQALRGLGRRDASLLKFKFTHTCGQWSHRSCFPEKWKCQAWSAVSELYTVPCCTIWHGNVREFTEVA